jgi:hypothetical protein
MDRCLASSPVDVFFGGVRTSVLNIVKDGVVEEDGVLRNDSDGLPEAFQRDVLDILAVDFDLQTRWDVQNPGVLMNDANGLQKACRRATVASLKSWPSI